MSSGQSEVNRANLSLGQFSGNFLETRVILRINAKDIKIIDSFSESVSESYRIDQISFAAQDSTQQCLFRTMTINYNF